MSEPYPIGMKFMIWSRFEDEQDLCGTIFVIEKYKMLWGRWHYSSELPWLSTADEMNLIERG